MCRSGLALRSKGPASQGPARRSLEAISRRPRAALLRAGRSYILGYVNLIRSGSIQTEKFQGSVNVSASGTDPEPFWCYLGSIWDSRGSVRTCAASCPRPPRKVTLLGKGRALPSDRGPWAWHVPPGVGRKCTQMSTTRSPSANEGRVCTVEVVTRVFYSFQNFSHSGPSVGTEANSTGL